MAYNVPTYETDKFSFGPARLYAAAIGITPTICIGGVRSAGSFVITRTMLDVMQGSPATLVKRYVTAESGILTMTGIEWDFSNFANVLGAGTTSDTTFEFGGSMSVRDLALRVVHVNPVGHTFTLDIWLANGQGTLTIPFGDDIHEFEYAFAALMTATNWAGVALTAGKQLFKILKET